MFLIVWKRDMSELIKRIKNKQNTDDRISPVNVHISF